MRLALLLFALPLFAQQLEVKFIETDVGSIAPLVSPGIVAPSDGSTLLLVAARTSNTGADAFVLQVDLVSGARLTAVALRDPVRSHTAMAVRIPSGAAISQRRVFAVTILEIATF